MIWSKRCERVGGVPSAVPLRVAEVKGEDAFEAVSPFPVRIVPAELAHLARR